MGGNRMRANLFAFLLTILFSGPIIGGSVSAAERTPILKKDWTSSPRIRGLPDDLKQRMRECFDSEIMQFSPTRGFNGPSGHADCRPAHLPFCEHTSDLKDL